MSIGKYSNSCICKYFSHDDMSIGKYPNIEICKYSNIYIFDCAGGE